MGAVSPIKNPGHGQPNTNKPNSEEDNIFIRKIENNSDNKIAKIGIETLLPDCVFEKRFYEEKVKNDEYGGEVISRKLNKVQLCNYLCNEKRQKNDFIKFSDIISMLDEFLES